MNSTTFPTEILLLVFSFVEKRQFPQLMQVCKRWKEACEKDALWKNEAESLKLQGPLIRQQIKGHVLSIRALFRELKPFPLEEIVQIAVRLIFDQPVIPVAEQLQNEVPKQSVLQVKIFEQRSFICLLNQLGLFTDNTVAQFAAQLEECHKDSSLFIQLFNSKMAQNKTQEALEILEKSKMEPEEKRSILVNHLAAFWKEEKYDEAIAFLEEACSNNVVAVQAAFIMSMNEKQYKIAEQILDRFIASGSKFKSVTDLIYAFLNDKEASEADRLLEKYEKDLVPTDAIDEDVLISLRERLDELKHAI